MTRAGSFASSKSSIRTASWTRADMSSAHTTERAMKRSTDGRGSRASCIAETETRSGSVAAVERRPPAALADGAAPHTLGWS